MTCVPLMCWPHTASPTMTAVCILTRSTRLSRARIDMHALFLQAGVLALMVSQVAHETLQVASRLVDGAIASLGRKYTGLHVRCGGSLIPVGTCNVCALRLVAHRPQASDLRRCIHGPIGQCRLLL